jgi:hypothetical protein
MAPSTFPSGNSSRRQTLGVIGRTLRIVDSSTIATLVESLAAVGIAAVGGPALATASVGLAVPLARAAWDRHAATRQLQRQVEGSINHWVESEGLSDHVAAGLSIATSVVRRFGLSEQDLRQLAFNAERATEAVIARAERADSIVAASRPQEEAIAKLRRPDAPILGSTSVDPLWRAANWSADDPAYVVARNAIRAMIAGLLGERHAIEATVLDAIGKESATIIGQIAGIDSSMNRLSDEFVTLIDALLATADVGDVLIYLQHAILAWDQSWWSSSQRPSQIERTLMVSVAGEGATAMSGIDALARFQHLVILGGPGSGKSWLARRFARECAQVAHRQLSGGAPLENVQLPLLTTWDTWTHYRGSTRESLVEASFDVGNGIGDLGGTEVVQRLARTFKHSGQSVLMIIDSLDESSDQARTPARVSDLESISGWQTVVTSRQGAWQAKPLTRERSYGVAEIRPLAWDDDILPFINSWFARDQQKRAALVRQISTQKRTRAALQVPLLLTFYCMYAERAPKRSLLPASHRELYRSVIEDLLKGEWTDAAYSRQAGACMEVLKGWAWHAVSEANTPAGLGAWGETFVPSVDPDASIARALDNIAPIEIDQYGRARRRFRHRTLLEYLVAEHIGTLSVEEAVKELLPHLWFDPDWANAAPSAISLHPLRNQLLAKLLGESLAGQNHPQEASLNREIDRLILGVAAESVPDDWDESSKVLIQNTRVKCAISEPTKIAQSTHWRQSNGAVLSRVLSALARLGPIARDRLVALLPLIAEEDAGRRRAIDSVLALLEASFPEAMTGLVAALVDLDASPHDLQAALTHVMAKLPVAEPWTLSRLVEVLPLLGAGDIERRAALSLILARLGPATIGPGSTLASVLSVLCSRDSDRKAVVQRVIEILSEASGSEVSSIVDLLPDIVVEESDRRSALSAVLNGFSSVQPSELSHLVRALGRLRADGAQRRIAIDTILERFASIEPLDCLLLQDALLGLDPGSDDCSVALEAGAASLQEEGFVSLSYLTRRFPQLIAGGADVRVALEAVVECAADRYLMPGTNFDWITSDLFDQVKTKGAILDSLLLRLSDVPPTPLSLSLTPLVAPTRWTRVERQQPFRFLGITQHQAARLSLSLHMWFHSWSMERVTAQRRSMPCWAQSQGPTHPLMSCISPEHFWP